MKAAMTQPTPEELELLEFFESMAKVYGRPLRQAEARLARDQARYLGEISEGPVLH
jgi:hypothetical protein